MYFYFSSRMELEKGVESSSHLLAWVVEYRIGEECDECMPDM